MSAYQGVYGDFLLMLLKAVQQHCMFVRVSATASSAFRDFPAVVRRDRHLQKYPSRSIPATLDFYSSRYICAGWHAPPWTRPASQQRGPALTQSRAPEPQFSTSPTLLRQMRRHNKKLRDCEKLRGEQ